MSGPLRLLAEDAEDLALISAALQDAVARVGDITFEQGARRLTVAFNRYCWEASEGLRVRAGFQLGGVLSVRSRRVRQDAKDAVLELLALSFEAGEAPGGIVTLAFAGGGDLVAEVECIDAALADISPPWPAAAAPGHAES